MTRKEIKEIANDARVQLRLNAAIRIAARSGMKLYHTGAILVASNGDILAHGWSHYSDSYRFANYPRSIHAELHAILRTPQRKDLVGATVYVANVRPKNGNVVNGAPCMFCQQVLQEVGVSTAFYTISGKSWGKLDLT